MCPSAYLCITPAFLCYFSCWEQVYCTLFAKRVKTHSSYLSWTRLYIVFMLFQIISILTFFNANVGLYQWKSIRYSGGYRFQHAMQIKSRKSKTFFYLLLKSFCSLLYRFKATLECHFEFRSVGRWWLWTCQGCDLWWLSTKAN